MFGKTTCRRAATGLACALVASLVSGASWAQTIAKVDGIEITEDDAAIAFEDLGPTLPPQMNPSQKREYIFNYLIDLKLTARKAAADKLDKGPDFERKMTYFLEKARMQALLDTIRTKAVTETEINRVYNEAATSQGSQTEVKASHILVESEEQATEALKRVRGGEDFAKVATEISKDPGSPGGELGWFTKEKMVPEFADLAFKTTPGQITEPVKSRFGWHIIKVEDHRTQEFPPLADVRGQVEQFITRKSHAEAIQSLRGNAKIEQFQPVEPALNRPALTGAK